MHGVLCSSELQGPERLAAILLGLPKPAAFSHLTAAELHGLPLSRAQECRVGVDVVRPGYGAQTRRPEIRGHRGWEIREIVERGGLPVVSAADTWCDFGELIRRDRLSVEDLVVLGDAAANVILRPDHTAYDFSDHRPLWWADMTLEERLAARDLSRVKAVGVLRGRLEARVRPRGKVALSQALPLIRPGVRSPMETRARLVFVSAEFPEPEVNLDVYSDEGAWLGEGDLVWPEQRVIGEYQGALHADRKRASLDADKRERLGDHGWRSHEIWLEDLTDWSRRRALLARFARLLGHPYP